MRMKRIAFLISMLIALLFSVSAYAADEVIYTCTEGIKTAEKAVELEGWGYEVSDTCFYEADVKFGGAGAGFTLMNSDGTKGGTSIRAVDRDGTLTLAADGGTGSYFIYYIPVDTRTWYHIKLIGSYGVENALVDMEVDTYDADMKIIDTKNYYVILMNEMYASSGNAPEHIRAEANTEMKNIAVTRLVPDAAVINAPAEGISAGSGIDITVKAYRQGTELNCALNPVYSVSGAEGVSVDNGRVEVSKDAEPGKSFKVSAECGVIKAEAEFKIVSDEAMEIETAYIDEEKQEITAVDIKRNFYVSGDCAVVVNVYSGGILIDSFVKPFNAASMENGDFEQIPVGYKYRAIMSECETEISVWCIGSGNKPVLNGKPAIRSFFEDCGGAVEWNEDFRSITAAAGGNVYVMQVGSNKLYIDGSVSELTGQVYIENDRAYADFDINLTLQN